MRRVIVIVVLAAVFVAAAVPILGSAQGSGAASSGASSAQTASKQATVGKGEVLLTVSSTGKIVVKQTSNLSFDQSGQVKEILVKEGQSVKAGDVLARVDDATLQASLAQAQDAVNAAEASLQKLLRPVDASDIAKAEANVKSAQASYSSKAGGTSLETIHSYELQYQKALAAADAAEQNRIRAGGQTEGVSDPNYQTYVAKVGQAQIAAETARLQWQQSQTGSSLLSATAQITYAQALLAQVKAGPTQAEISAAQATLVSAQLKLAQAKHNLDKAQLVAPYAGIISSISAKIGEISSGTAMVITDTNELAADINVDEAEIGKIQVGQVVSITLDALSGVTLTGKVQHIAETADTSSSVITYVVRVALDPTKAAIKPGMSLNAALVVKDLKNVLRVSNDYLKTNRTLNQTTVNLVNADGSVTVVPIQIGVQGTDYSEVIGGLNEGETITPVTTSTTTSNTSNNG